MIVNNFDKFQREFIPWEFYFVQVIIRWKDHPWKVGVNWSNHARTLKNYSIYNAEQLEKYKRDIMEVADIRWARVYVRPARRSKKMIAYKMIEMLWEHLQRDVYTLSWLYDQACWLDKWTERLWIIDIDDKSDSFLQEVVDKVNSIQPFNCVRYSLPTKAGFHIITKPFDLRQFTYRVDIHKNNPTLLYFNSKDVTIAW